MRRLYGDIGYRGEAAERISRWVSRKTALASRARLRSISSTTIQAPSTPRRRRRSTPDRNMNPLNAVFMLAASWKTPHRSGLPRLRSGACRRQHDGAELLRRRDAVRRQRQLQPAAGDFPRRGQSRRHRPHLERARARWAERFRWRTLRKIFPLPNKFTFGVNYDIWLDVFLGGRAGWLALTPAISHHRLLPRSDIRPFRRCSNREHHRVQ